MPMSEILHVRCVVCGDVLSYQREDTTALLVHLRKAHPKLNLARLDLTWLACSGDPSTKSPPSRESTIVPTCKPYCKSFEMSERSYASTLCKCEPDADCNRCGCNPCEVLAYEKARMGSKKRSHSASSVQKRAQKDQIKKMYHTTVETWRPGNSKIVCPKCSFAGQPIVRRQRNRVYSTPVGALCMLGCWPICFLPFMLCGDQVVNLHCAQCNYYLGTYDRKKSELVQENTPASSITDKSQSAPVICACGPGCQ